jgi:membrane protease YdiL (CAAX protease family)
MNIKKIILIFLTIGAVLYLVLSLVSSLNQPQIQSRLELYQTNILLKATDWQPTNLEQIDQSNFALLQKSLVGSDVNNTALKQYTEALNNVQKSIDQALALEKAKAASLVANNDQNTDQLINGDNTENTVKKKSVKLRTPQSIRQLGRLQYELDLRIGILQVATDDPKSAINTWQNLSKNLTEVPDLQDIRQTADLLFNLYQPVNQVTQQINNFTDAEILINTNLDGWFKDFALNRLYEKQGDQVKLATLQATRQANAEKAVIKLLLITGLPGIGFLTGLGLLGFLAVQYLIKRETSILGKTVLPSWSIPWDGEIILQVFVIGFFLMGQIATPFILEILKSLTNLQPFSMGPPTQAGYIFVSYIIFAFSCLGVLYFSIKTFFPLPTNWFQFSPQPQSILWGIGGYFVAVPLVIIISLINQQIWQGQGGSNPILPIALQGQDVLTFTLFFLTASVAAPIFEEIIFRGFLLPSLTKYVPLWGAILLSSGLFAIAHLSLSEVLPLIVLGSILGFVYSRTQNLISSILLHSLWNSGTLISLYILGSGGI